MKKFRYTEYRKFSFLRFDGEALVLGIYQVASGILHFINHITTGTYNVAFVLYCKFFEKIIIIF
jgi:hypothetical protein